MHGDLSVNDAGQAVGGELHAEDAIGGLAVAAAAEETAQPAPRVREAQERQRDGQPIAEGHLEPPRDTGQRGGAAKDARHGGHVAPRCIWAVDELGEQERAEQATEERGEEAIMKAADEFRITPLPAGGEVHAEEQGDEPAPKHQAIQVQLTLSRPKVDVYVRPHPAQRKTPGGSFVHQVL